MQKAENCLLLQYLLSHCACPCFVHCCLRFSIIHQVDCCCTVSGFDMYWTFLYISCVMMILFSMFELRCFPLTMFVKKLMASAILATFCAASSAQKPYQLFRWLSFYHHHWTLCMRAVFKSIRGWHFWGFVGRHVAPMGVLWIGFCHTGSISLCVVFLCLSVCILHMLY